jgi:hypothetical protein
MRAAIEVIGGRDNLVQGNLVSRGATDAITARDGSARVQGNLIAGES